MTETQVGFLYKAASSLQRAGDNKNLTLLRSYYLMRCKNITKGYGLPEKHFSSKVRCSKCCIEWNKETETKVKALKLSKKQRQKIRTQSAKKNNKELIGKRQQLINSNEIVQICSFCNQSTITTATKPEKIKLLENVKKNIKSANLINVQSNNSEATTKTKKSDQAKSKKESKKSKVNKSKEINVYSVTKDVFSLNNKKNVLAVARKEEQKIIKNNKKKKDKYAGLCKKAVLATAEMKDKKNIHNKLNLFLKPST